MHDPSCEGNDFFKCDFCRRSWSEDLPMVEGHQGSLVCARCLTVAFTRVMVATESTAPAGYTCAMCLEERPDPAWQSPDHPEAVICKRCINQAAVRLERDPDSDWQRPAKPIT